MFNFRYELFVFLSISKAQALIEQIEHAYSTLESVWSGREEMPLKTCFLANEKQPATGGDRCKLSVETAKGRLSVRVGS